jgi:peptidoglycan/LPS O-acetylase OafA/YrhL
MKNKKTSTRQSRSLNWSLLSNYRMELFGIAIIAVLCVHSVPYLSGFGFPISALVKMFSYGGIGVDIFLFLSGVGLCFSMRKGTNWRTFYENRVKRLIIPYLLISVVAYFIIDIIISRQPLYFFYDLSSLSFWGEQRGAWYVAMIVPIYVLFPFYYRWLQSRKNKLLSIAMCIAISVICTEIVHYYNASLYENLLLVLMRIPIFFLGCLFSYQIFEKQSVKTKTMLNFVILLFLLLVLWLMAKTNVLLPFIKESVYNYVLSLSAIPLCFLLALFIEKLKFDVIGKTLRFFGKYSLELYLTNIYVKWIFDYVDINYLNHHQAIKYLIIIVIGICCSVLFKKLQDGIEKYFVPLKSRNNMSKET